MESRRYFCLLAITVLLVSAYFAPTLADENEWSTGGPYGASIMDIALHPSDTLRMYIGTVALGIFQTTDGGEEWSRIETDTLEITQREIRIHPFGPDTMYAATARGVFKSTDAGQSWFRLPVEGPTGEYRSFEIHPGDPSMLFTGHIGGPEKSTDGGASWYRNDGGQNGNVVDVKIDPVNTNIVYLTGGRDFRSTDYGENWYDISPDPFGTTSPVSMDIDPVNTEIIYLGRWDFDETGTCLYKSTNGGDDWTNISPPGLVKVLVYDIEISPFDHNTVFIATYEDGIFRSPDGGETWEEINEGLAVRKTNSIVIDPRTGYIYLGLYYDGVYRSIDNGDSWQKISYYNVSGAYCRIIAANWRHPDTLYLAAVNGLFISIDGAQSWERAILDYDPGRLLGCSGVTVDPYDPNYVYAAFSASRHWIYDGDFYRSTDGGFTWESFTEGLPPDDPYFRVAVADYGSGWRRLFMKTWAGVYYSDDLGERWSLGGLPNIAIGAIGISPLDPEIVFAGDYSSGAIYKSTDGGGTWEPLNNTPRADHVKEIVCDPVDQDIVYVALGGSRGIYKSTDGGQTWDNINNNLPRPEYPYLFGVSGISVNPLNHDNIFVYSYYQGVFQSHDGGQSWEDFYNESLRIGSLGRTLIDPVDTSRVFLAQHDGSVWSITRTPTGIEDDPDYLQPVVFSTSSYPNPFNPSTTIEYNLPEQAFVTVDIYDLLGRKVERLVGQNQQAGRYRVVWEAKEQASGVYFYRIDAGEISHMRKMILLK